MTAPRWIRIDEAVKFCGVPKKVLLYELGKPQSGCEVRAMGARGMLHVREDMLAAYCEREGLTRPIKQTPGETNG